MSVSFSGELAYEVAVPTRYGDALIRKLAAAGAEFDAVVYGTEALGVMRHSCAHVMARAVMRASAALKS